MKILLAEDEANMVNVLKRAFTSKSIAVDVATDGEQALHFGLVNDYDAILLDVNMPQMEGFEVCKRLRARKKKTPIIMISARGSVPDKVRGLDSGADDYLAKPFSFSELMARIAALGRRKEVFRDVVLTYRDVVLDRNARKVTRNDNEIELSPKEYRILEYLIQHPGQVMTRFSILENVWGSGDENLSNVVDVHVSHLRIKLNKGSNDLILETVRGGGYVLR